MELSGSAGASRAPTRRKRERKQAPVASSDQVAYILRRAIHRASVPAALARRDFYAAQVLRAH